MKLKIKYPISTRASRTIGKQAGLASRRPERTGVGKGGGANRASNAADVSAPATASPTDTRGLHGVAACIPGIRFGTGRHRPVVGIRRDDADESTPDFLSFLAGSRTARCPTVSETAESLLSNLTFLPPARGRDSRSRGRLPRARRARPQTGAEAPRSAVRDSPGRPGTAPRPGR